MNDTITGLDTKFQVKLKYEFDELLDRLRKSHDEVKARIKTAETYVQDKIEATRLLIKDVDIKTQKTASVDMIDELREKDTSLKINF